MPPSAVRKFTLGEKEKVIAKDGRVFKAGCEVEVRMIRNAGKPYMRDGQYVRDDVVEYTIDGEFIGPAIFYRDNG